MMPYTMPCAASPNRPLVIAHLRSCGFMFGWRFFWNPAV